MVKKNNLGTIIFGVLVILFFLYLINVNLTALLFKNTKNIINNNESILSTNFIDNDKPILSNNEYKTSISCDHTQEPLSSNVGARVNYFNSHMDN